MNNTEFYMLKKPLCIAYAQKFGYEPSIENFDCTRQDFINALKTSIDIGKQIEVVLSDKKINDN